MIYCKRGECELNGVVHLTVTNHSVSYDLTFRHNISILRGDSGTGKSALCAMISEPSGVQISHTKGVAIRVMPAIPEWQIILMNMHDTLIFLDETCTFVHSVEFAKTIQNTTNYYVFITRQDIPTLPYSVFAIYTLSYSRIYANQKPVVINNKLIYTQQPYKYNGYDLIITEDSGTGSEFWGNFFHRGCIGAGGNSKVLDTIKHTIKKDESLIIIVDGAAFGALFAKVDDYLHMNDISAVLLLPESFEWLLLHHSCFSRNSQIVQILNNPEDYIDYSIHYSFEQFYYSELIKACDLLNISYSKGKPLDKTF